MYRMLTHDFLPYGEERKPRQCFLLILINITTYQHNLHRKESETRRAFLSYALKIGLPADCTFPA